MLDVVSGVAAGELVFAPLGCIPEGLDDGFADWSVEGVPDVLVEFGITVPALVSALVFALLP